MNPTWHIADHIETRILSNLKANKFELRPPISGSGKKISFMIIKIVSAQSKAFKRQTDRELENKRHTRLQCSYESFAAPYAPAPLLGSELAIAAGDGIAPVAIAAAGDGIRRAGSEVS